MNQFSKANVHKVIVDKQINYKNKMVRPNQYQFM